MSVLQMCKLNICAMKQNRKAVLEYLQTKGCLEIEEQKSGDLVFSKTDTASSISIFDANAQTAENAILVLDNYAPQKSSMLSSLEGKEQIEFDEYTRLSKEQKDIMDLVSEILIQKKNIDNDTSDIAKCEEEIKSLEPWQDLDVPMNFLGTKYTEFIVGILSDSYTQEQLNERLLEIAGDESLDEDEKRALESLDLKVISYDKYQTYVAGIFMRGTRELVEKIMRQLGFSKPPIDIHHTPAVSIQKRKDRIKNSEDDIQSEIAKITEESKRRADIKRIADYYRMRSQKYQILGELLQSKHTFFITGFIPKRDAEDLKQALEDRFDAAVDIEDVPRGDDTPVVLSNNYVSGGVEDVVSSFGLPNKKEFDPTAITSVFYYLLFGIMLSDAAYGLIIFLGCFILLKKYPHMSESMSKTFRMFMYCGLSTLFWGILFGGYFGDAVQVISGTFFGTTVSIPAVWFAPIDEPMKMLMYCLAFGIIHLFVGLGIKGYMMLKKKDVEAFVFDIVCWYVLLVGLILMLLPTQIFASLAGFSLTFPTWLVVMSYIMAVVGALGILVMAGRRSKNPGKRLLLGAYSLYDITSWLSDLLSYSRLLALGLATSVIAQVVNTMAAMGGRSVFGVILFVVVFIFGHLFNLAINLLGAYVHTNRLQFVEFFGKFYEGGGREFHPFKADTKYIHVKEN